VQGRIEAWTKEQDAKTETPRAGFKTVSIDGPTTGTSMKRVAIWALQKSGVNPHADRISVGRAPNCDIVIEDETVSKLHAHVRRTPTGCELVDVGSSNGTTLRTQKLAVGKAAPLSPGDPVQFGSVAVQYFAADKLYDLL
jgi:hypothetical protein